MYLLDTGILSNLMKRAPLSALMAKVTRVPLEHQFTSNITLGKLVHGAHRATSDEFPGWKQRTGWRSEWLL